MCPCAGTSLKTGLQADCTLFPSPARSLSWSAVARVCVAVCSAGSRGPSGVYSSGIIFRMSMPKSIPEHLSTTSVLRKLRHHCLSTDSGSPSIEFPPMAPSTSLVLSMAHWRGSGYSLMKRPHSKSMTSLRCWRQLPDRNTQSTPVGASLIVRGTSLPRTLSS